MSPAPPRGPHCTCGCSAVEHELHVGTDWRWVPGRCLTCSDCEEFVLDETVAGFVYEDAVDGLTEP